MTKRLAFVLVVLCVACASDPPPAPVAVPPPAAPVPPAIAAAPSPSTPAPAEPPPEPSDDGPATDPLSIAKDNGGEHPMLGPGRPPGRRPPPPPSIQAGAVQVTGRLPPEVVSRVVRQQFGRYRVCYERGLAKQATLAGRIDVSFGIDATGAVTNPRSSSATVTDKDTVDCVVQSFGKLAFPQPESGVVSVVYPLVFAPGR